MSFTRKELANLKPRFLDRMQVIESATVVARELGININTAHVWAREAGLKSRRPLHQHKTEYLTLCEAGHSQAAASRQAGVHVRTCHDWEHGVTRSKNVHTYPDGRRVDSNTGTTTMVDMTTLLTPGPNLAALKRELHPRFLPLVKREQIADLRRDGLSLRAIGRQLGRPAATIKREIDHHQHDDGVYQLFAAHRRAAL